MNENNLTEYNKKMQALAETIVKAQVVDWAGNVLFETMDYWKALEYYERLTEEAPEVTEDIYLASYDKDGVDHGIFY